MVYITRMSHGCGWVCPTRGTAGDGIGPERSKGPDPIHCLERYTIQSSVRTHARFFLLHLPSKI